MRKIISNIALWGGMVAGGMLLASCGDRDFFNPYNKADQYAANWEQKIGAIDPNQDWSMATTVKATINVAAAGDGVLSIYTENPVHSTAKLLAKAFLDNGTGNVTFDAVKGTEQVFVIARNNGKNVVYGWADIVNGTVDAGKTVAKKAAKTRAGEYCPVTKGETTNLFSFKTKNPDKDVVTTVTKLVKGTYNGNPSNYQTFDEWVATIEKHMEDNKANGMFYSYPDAPFKKESVVTYNDKKPWEEGFEYTYHPSSEWQLADGWEYMEIETGRVEGYDELNIDVTLLNGVEKKPVQEPWTLAWGYELFGPGAFFEEQIRYDNTVKQNLSGYNLQEVEQGFSITTSKNGSEVTVPFMYGSTDGQNRFGYVYYKGNLSYNQILAQPHYILMEDATPGSNIFYEKWGNIENSVGPMGLAAACQNGKDSQTEVYGTEYKLAFFGEDHNQPASYEFPQGYHIVFFIAPYSGGYKTDMYNYSLPELNKLIGHYQQDSNGNKDTNRGNVMATAWKYNGKIFMGMEDKAYYVDADLNDVVFWVEGDFTPDQKVPEVSSTTQPKEEYTSWILACEDLGSTDDYDFNDIVLEVRTKIESEETFEGSAKTGETFKKATLEMRCLAAGGIYEANIHYNNTWIGESHNLLGGRVGTMINTEQLGRFSDWRTLETITDKDAWNNIGDAWSINNVANKIKIVVTIDGKTAESALIKAPDSGEAPQMITVPGDWLWPAERKDIKLAYLSFSNWNANSNDIEWYKKCESGLVIKR